MFWSSRYAIRKHINAFVHTRHYKNCAVSVACPFVLSRAPISVSKTCDFPVSQGLATCPRAHTRVNTRDQPDPRRRSGRYNHALGRAAGIPRYTRARSALRTTSLDAEPGRGKRKRRKKSRGAGATLPSSQRAGAPTKGLVEEDVAVRVDVLERRRPTRHARPPRSANRGVSVFIGIWTRLGEYATMQSLAQRSYVSLIQVPKTCEALQSVNSIILQLLA